MERAILSSRRKMEVGRMHPIEDEYGVERLDAMLREVEEEYESGRLSYPLTEKQEQQQQEQQQQEQEQEQEQEDQEDEDEDEDDDEDAEEEDHESLSADVMSDAPRYVTSITTLPHALPHLALTHASTPHPHSAHGAPNTPSRTTYPRPIFHWSRRLEPGNPRGYTPKELHALEAAPDAASRREVELEVLQTRLGRERALKHVADDEFGVEALERMVAEVEAEYAEARYVADDDDYADNHAMSETISSFTHPTHIHSRPAPKRALRTPKSTPSKPSPPTPTPVAKAPRSAPTPAQKRGGRHWSYRVTATNPRGYLPHELASIRQTASREARRKAELQVVAQRLARERAREVPLDDEYGVECLERMAEDIEEEYRQEEEDEEDEDEVEEVEEEAVDADAGVEDYDYDDAMNDDAMDDGDDEHTHAEAAAVNRYVCH
jgi:hypothetical protein